MDVALNILALALLVTAGVAFTRQQGGVLIVCGALFVPVAGAATWAVFWPVHPALAVLVLAGTLGLSVLMLALYAIDRVWAPFCMEMTYPAMIFWLLWPLLVLVNFAGLLL